MSPRQVVPRRAVSARRCSCGAAVLSALTGNGLDVTVDAAQLSPIGELEAVLAGVSTYTHHQVPGELHHRSALSIRTRPAGTRPRQSAHALHRCGDTWPALDTRTPAAAAPTPDAPPF